MTTESYKAWLDAMPIGDVAAKIERLEQKVADLRVLERLYAERRPAGAAAAETSSEPVPENAAEAQTQADASGEEGSSPQAPDAAPGYGPALG